MTGDAARLRNHDRSLEVGDLLDCGEVAGQTVISRHVLAWLEAYDRGLGLPCVHTTSDGRERVRWLRARTPRRDTYRDVPFGLLNIASPHHTAHISLRVRKPRYTHRRMAGS